MPDSHLVRASRDGDQFHYLWAARRCLKLLESQSGLVAVAIEGASPSEHISGDKTADEIIDIAEYFGDEHVEQASLVRYMQLKHSTLHASEPWTASGLEKTIKGFCLKYNALRKQLKSTDLVNRVEFWFVTNRPLGTNYRETIEDAAQNKTSRHPEELKKLESHTGLNGAELALFCQLVRFDDRQDNCWEQRNLLFQDISGYLADADVDAPVQLKELVNTKALSVSQTNPTITKHDVLRVLKTDEDALFPATCLITRLTQAIPRAQETDLFAEIVNAGDRPIILHAEAGVGKSIFATRIEIGMPAGSVTVLYDCFGNGRYRNVSEYRHRHKDALVQIANELSAKALCHPLIPTPNADASRYVKAFKHRLQQSVDSIRARQPNGLLAIVIDAGDNAQIAADEIGEPHSFVRDLVREQMPDGVRLVVLCRTHRQKLLDPPPSALPLELKSFSREETADHLRQTFPSATPYDIDEFHRLSSQNPRVQSLALSRKLELSETLRLLGPNPTTVEDTIGQILQESITKLRDAVGSIEKEQIDRICIGLAALRPLIPIEVLSAISGVDQGAVKSFAIDLGRPLIVNGNTIQFYDEPAETWFRERFKPDVGSLGSFVDILRPVASKSAYAASMLPQLMLEAGQLSELVALALSSEALPEGTPLERRDVELRRLQFALKASLRGRRYVDAAKLALKAGGETAGETRQRALLQNNTDLAALFLGSNGIQEVVSRRTFGSGWVGSHHAYEAALMSANRDLAGEARSRLRMAHAWLRNWSRLPDEGKQKEQISDADIAEIAMAHLNIHGAASCAHNLRGWSPCDISYRVGCILVRRLIEHARFDDINQLALEAKNDIGLVLAIVVELRDICHLPPTDVVRRVIRLLCNDRVKIGDSNQWDDRGRVTNAITAVVEAAIKLAVCDEAAAQKLLLRYLPDQPPRDLASRFGSSRFTFLRAYALRAAFAGQTLTLLDIAYPELRKELEKRNQYQHSTDAQEFQEDVGALLPWHELWATAFLGHVPQADIAAAIDAAKAASAKAEKIYYREQSHTADEIARLWIETLAIAGTLDDASIERFASWSASLRQPLFTPTLLRAAKLAARFPTLHKHALTFARKAFQITKDARDPAESKADGYIDVARSILTVSHAEAEAFFNEAVEVSNKIGDENLDRWGAFLDLADRARKPGRPDAQVAYKFSRCAELTYEYVVRDKYFNWRATVRALAGLCPVSSVAIHSRWRDRRFGSEERILPDLVESLIERNAVEPMDVLALIGIRASWDHPKILRAALARNCDDSTRKAASALVYRYMSLEQQSAQRWTELKTVTAGFGISLDGLDQEIAHNQLKEGISRAQKSEDEPWRSGSKTLERDWDAIFRDLDLTKPNDISLSNTRYRELEPPFTQEDFLQQSFRRVPVGREAEFVRAFADVAEFDLYHLRNLLEQIPAGWRSSLSVRSALASTVIAYARRYCMEITKNRYYQVLPFELISGLSGVREDELMKVILEAVGDTPELAGAERLFTLVGLLAVLLTEDQALEALSFGLGLLDEVLEEKDGDGPWAKDLVPPCDIETSIAGYIWAGLGSPDSALRWESAHCVLVACQSGRGTLLSKLVGLAQKGQSQPFVDARLPFYERHACQWLLIALARASKSFQVTVAPHFDFLVDAALNGEPHVLMRRYASDAALTLVETGAVAVEPEIKARLTSVNSSPFPVVKGNYYDRDKSAEDVQPDDEDRFYFGIDIGPYWYAPLARCFALTQQRIEREALKVIRDDWHFKGQSRWDNDERARRGYYRDGESYHSHGSYPRIDDMTFYLSYHAMMVVAGKLLTNCPILQSPHNTENELDGWINGHAITRADGYWLADRRDPVPLEWPAWKNEQDDKDWRWSVSRCDFDRVLVPSQGRFNLWGNWTNIDGRREEIIHVSSALVTPQNSLALLRALQTVQNPHDFKIPDAGDDLEISHGDYRLKGWVVDNYRDRELDGHDPWGGKISYPPPKPAAYIVKLLGLQADRDLREWKTSDPTRGLWSTVWGHFTEKDSDETYESGNRLQASNEFVVEMLAKTGMNLIVEVEIRRQHVRRRYDSRDEDSGFDYIYPSSRLFVIKPDGQCISL